MRFRVTAMLLLLASAGSQVAQADVRPDPTNPTGAYSPIYLVLLVVIGVGIYLYRRRNSD